MELYHSCAKQDGVDDPAAVDFFKPYSFGNRAQVIVVELPAAGASVYMPVVALPDPTTASAYQNIVADVFSTKGLILARQSALSASIAVSVTSRPIFPQ